MTVHYLNRVNPPEAAMVDHCVTPRSARPLARLLCRLGLHAWYLRRAWHARSHRGSPVIEREYRCERCPATWTTIRITNRG